MSLALTAALVVTAPACSSTHATEPSRSSTTVSARPAVRALIGLFRLDAGACSSGTVTGSYLRMVFPGGSVARGKFFPNPDSRCADATYTTVQPGTDGGLTTNRYQPQPSPPFDAHGDALAAAIMTPQTFSAIAFSVSTNAVDPQTKRKVPAPTITVDHGRLSGDTRAMDAAWNRQQFNQGSPKPDGSRPGLTTPITGTYDTATGRFVLEWSSQIVGGPFNDFTGVWHLAGTFVPSDRSTP